MGIMAVFGIVNAFLVTWVSGGDTLFLWLGCRLHDAFRQPWRLVTSGLLTDPTQWMHLVFSLVGLYFLAPSLEQRWGGGRLLRFLALAVVCGSLTTLAVDAIAPGGTQARFHPELVFGPSAMITAIAVGWSREYAQSTVNLFFFLPIRGRVLFWVTVGFCVLDLIFPASLPEGVVAPFGGVIAGLVFGGTPSLARKAWLHLKLAVLRRQSTSVRVEDVLAAKPKRRSRAGSPPLRVVSGGLEEVLKQRTPPKDKRYLN
jgi:membrane associated rhomboid family serine protease